MSNGNRASTLKKHLGKGWNFPVYPAPRVNALVHVDGPDKVRQAIWLILETEPGERLMRPNFGCGLRRYLMKPNNSATRALMQRDIERALATWEPRIKTEEISVEPGSDPALVLIQIHYTHIRDGSPGNLVYPFYLE
ncbi:MAG: GPW/gp25 family protein [Gammaproteobacteria bacterium]|nr:GPW/gp25 family protein [Gammaproteobacteria bacterium]